MNVVGPNTRRAAKLLRYLMDGHSVVVDGDVYLFKNRMSLGASNGLGIDVSDYSFGEFILLAEVLDGKDLINVMNYKGNKNEKFD